jgi:putative restriction endonuclease
MVAIAMDAVGQWLSRLCNLNVARTRARGLAPHKPVLMLSLVDMVEERALTSPWLVYTPQLLFRFQSYWDIVRARQQNRPNMRMPFHALGSERDRVWACFGADGSVSRSRETTKRCRIEDGLWACLQDSGFRAAVRSALIATYFTPAEQIALCSRLRLPEPSTSEIDRIRKRKEEYRASLRQGRDARFRYDVIIGYQSVCALTGYRLTTEEGSMVEAAHIWPHSKSKNDDPRNGLALTPDAHWMFDRGLWTVDLLGVDHVVVVVKARFDESSPIGRSLMAHDRQPLFFAPGTTLRPDPKCLEWHRNHHLSGRADHRRA